MNIDFTALIEALKNVAPYVWVAATHKTQADIAGHQAYGWVGLALAALFLIVSIFWVIRADEQDDGPVWGFFFFLGLTIFASYHLISAWQMSLAPDWYAMESVLRTIGVGK